jgi:hypothetical protein
VRRLFPLLLLTISVASAQRPRPAYDPETKDGLLIQHIQQENDPAQKLRYMEEFAAQYPSHPAIAWVYDQLQPAYFERKAWDDVMRVGALRLKIEPENLDAGKLALRAADVRHDTAQILSWADRVWPLATSLAQKGGATAGDAKQTAGYAEFLVYSTAMASTDPKARLELLQHLEQHMPSSKYTQGLTAEYFQIYRELGEEEKSIETAERGLQTEPGNVDMLLFLAEVHARKDNPRDRQLVINYTTKVLESMDQAQRPSSMNEEDWGKKKVRMLALANYLGGVSNSLNQNYARADTMLRAAVASMKDTDGQLAAALYHLGMANYRLAEASHDRTRPVDALKFMRRCAAIKSPYQGQALKNIEGIKAEYNLP